MKELKAAPGRTALIAVTVGMIAVMVTFLSALAAGLSQKAVSALDELYGHDDAVVLAEGASSLSASALSETVQSEVQQWAAQHSTAVRPVQLARARVGEVPVAVISDPSLGGRDIVVSDEVTDEQQDVDQRRSMRLSGAVGDVDAIVSSVKETMYLDHQPVVFAGGRIIEELIGSAQVPPAALVVRGGEDVTLNDLESLEGIDVLTGKDRKMLSAAYQGEQTSLTAMISMLYVISALVVGAFFTVWMVQRLRGVAISSALGASRKVLIADLLAQVLVVLLIGIGGGVALTAATGLALTKSGALSVVIDASTTVIPGLILGFVGVIGGVIALIPIFRVDPTTALANV